ncbi:MAG TPA: hypothetical protein VMH36_03260 [Alphaproteobacteria bacterium]|nr:hypothetical protein [Alphaproteobacteria bacterium]
MEETAHRVRPTTHGASLETVRISPVGLEGILGLPADAKGVVLFAHGSGSSRLSPRNTYVATALRQAGLGTLLFDLLTEQEADDRSFVFNIPLLATRLASAADWLIHRKPAAGLPVGLFGASTGAGAALVAAARYPNVIGAVVSRGGRPDLAEDWLGQVRAPTLLIVGGDDPDVLKLNRMAFARLSCLKELKVVPGATHLFEEPGKLDDVIDLARAWFRAHLTPGTPE